MLTVDAEAAIDSASGYFVSSLTLAETKGIVGLQSA
jgi:hypothetical protein